MDIKSPPDCILEAVREGKLQQLLVNPLDVGWFQVTEKDTVHETPDGAIALMCSCTDTMVPMSKHSWRPRFAILSNNYFIGQCVACHAIYWQEPPTANT